MPNSILVFNGLFTEKNCSKTSRFSHSIPGLFKDNGPIIDPLLIEGIEIDQSIILEGSITAFDNLTYGSSNEAFTLEGDITAMDNLLYGYPNEDISLTSTPVVDTNDTLINLIN